MIFKKIAGGIAFIGKKIAGVGVSAAHKVAGIGPKFLAMSTAKKVIAGVVATAVAGGSVTGGVVLAKNTGSNHNEPLEAVVVENTEYLALLETESEIEEPEFIIESVTEEDEINVSDRSVKLVGSSMEKDLKVKIQNSESKDITGQDFQITVQKKDGGKESTYDDEDKDGIIYIKSIEAGDYKVSMKEMPDFDTPDPINVTVKDKLEYKKVDVVDEVKQDSQVSAAEDAEKNNALPVESVAKDTVENLPSAVTPSEVPAANVNTSGFAKASASSETGTITFAAPTATVGIRMRTLLRTAEVPADPAQTTPTDPTLAAAPATPDPAAQPTTDPAAGSAGSSSGEAASGAGTPPTDTGASAEGTNTPASSGTEQSGQTPASTQGTEQSTEQSTQTPATETSSTQTTEKSTEKATEKSTEKATEKSTETTKSAVTVTYPKSITLYNGGGSASTTYTIALSVSPAANVTASWAAGNSALAVSGSGLKATVTAGSTAGSSSVSVTLTYGGKTQTISIPVTIKDVGTVELTDKSGNKLYKDKACTTVATLKDYKDGAVFYQPASYTGWQTIGGKTYYYGADHKPVTGTQTIGGVQYTFGADGALANSSGSRGIDVSKWQGNINWAAVKASGIDFAIIRLGYRGSQTGVLVEDPTFRKNIQGATAAGLRVGVYFFTQAVTEAEAVEEASMCLQLCSGYNLAFPIFIDTEDGARAQGLDRGTRTAICNAFCQTVANGGRRAGVYASTYWFNNQLNAGSLGGYTIWVAQYAAACQYGGKYHMWQYSSKGTVSGVSGACDMNISYM